MEGTKNPVFVWGSLFLFFSQETAGGFIYFL